MRAGHGKGALRQCDHALHAANFQITRTRPEAHTKNGNTLIITFACLFRHNWYLLRVLCTLTAWYTGDWNELDRHRRGVFAVRPIDSNPQFLEVTASGGTVPGRSTSTRSVNASGFAALK